MIKMDRSSQASTDASDEGDIDEISSEIGETTIWLEVVGGKNKKGRVFGVGSEADDIVCFGYGSSTSIDRSWMHPIFKEELDIKQKCFRVVLEVEADQIETTLREIIKTQAKQLVHHEDLFKQLMAKKSGHHSR